ncbi:hypothetical protein GCM10010420_54900 [Streptomyces glaucosporus]|uniref:Uncharacterized protein n=1 Tax=Streptomyces glaucosporus TaxID=284044 RepID=A0ABP5W5U9_9ACTN
MRAAWLCGEHQPAHRRAVLRRFAGGTDDHGRETELSVLAREEHMGEQLPQDMRNTVRAVRTLLDPDPQDACHKLLEAAQARLDTARRRFP